MGLGSASVAVSLSFSRVASPSACTTRKALMTLHANDVSHGMELHATTVRPCFLDLPPPRTVPHVETLTVTAVRGDN